MVCMYENLVRIWQIVDTTAVSVDAMVTLYLII